jgi:hypothetical protein
MAVRPEGANRCHQIRSAESRFRGYLGAAASLVERPHSVVMSADRWPDEVRLFGQYAAPLRIVAFRRSPV